MTDPIYQYKIGTNIDSDFDYLTVQGIIANPRPSYRPFSVVDKLGNGMSEGNGFAVITWHWDIMRIGEADILRTYLSGGLSVRIFIRSRINELTTGAYTWHDFDTIMEWISGDEDIESKRIRDLTLQFKVLEQIPDPT